MKDIGDWKTSAEIEVEASGFLLNNNVKTQSYLEKVAWKKMSIPLMNPIYTGIMKELILTSKVNLNLANGKGGIELDWSDYDITDTYFVVYRKEENQTEWEKIVDLDDKLSSNSYIDILGNDKAKPEAPTVNIGTSSSGIQINLSSNDSGTTYSYYIEAYDISTGTLMKSSNVKSVKI